tara:strand:+ start:10599 stop:11525 length:927 start_codon:yes stop_codon:yes gene_type:complete
MIFKNFIQILCLSYTLGFSAIFSPEAQKFREQAIKLRKEVRILEEELLEQRNISATQIDENPIDVSEVGNYDNKRLNIHVTNSLKTQCILEDNSNTYIRLIDKQGDIFDHAIGKWFYKKSRFGIGANLFIRARGIGFCINYKFLSVSQSEYRKAVNTKSQFTSYQKELTVLSNRIINFLEKTEDITPPERLFPIISKQSLLSRFINFSGKWFRKTKYQIIKTFLRVYINSFRSSVDKWRDIADLSEIKINGQNYIIKKSGKLNTRSLIPLFDTWVRLPGYRYTGQCVLDLSNPRSSRTGGRIGGIKKA